MWYLLLLSLRLVSDKPGFLIGASRKTPARLLCFLALYSRDEDKRGFHQAHDWLFEIHSQPWSSICHNFWLPLPTISDCSSRGPFLSIATWIDCKFAVCDHSILSCIIFSTMETKGSHLLLVRGLVDGLLTCCALRLPQGSWDNWETDLHSWPSLRCDCSYKGVLDLIF